MGLSEIKGIGPATVKKLNTAGIRTLDDVRSMETQKVAEKTGIAESRLREWKTEARLLKVLDDVKGIGPATKKKLQDAGIHNLDDLARAATHELAHAANIAEERVKAWQKDANRLLKQAETKGREVAAEARKQGKVALDRSKEVATEVASEVRSRVNQRRQTTASPVEETDEPAATHSTNGTNGHKTGFFTRLRQILAPKRV